MNAMQRFWRRGVEMTRETQWLLPLVGAVAGVLLALAFGLAEASPDEVNWTLTVSDGRGTLLSWLSILFAVTVVVDAVDVVAGEPSSPPEQADSTSSNPAQRRRHVNALGPPEPVSRMLDELISRKVWAAVVTSSKRRVAALWESMQRW